MGKEDTLLKIRQAEAEVRTMREVAEQDRDRILREARREALDLRERLRAGAEERHRAILEDAEPAARAERDRILAAGRSGAEGARDRGRANVERAIGLVLEKFGGALNA